LGVLFLTGRGRAQPGGLPPTPVPVIPPAGSGPGTPRSFGEPTPVTPPITVIPPPSAPLDPLPLDAGARGCAPGWFLGTEFGVLKPRVKDHLRGEVTFPDGSTGVVTLPEEKLRWTGSFEFTLGYRLPDEQGSFFARYRFLSDSASTTVPAYGFFNEDGALKHRLSLNVFDLAYASAPYQFCPFWEMQWPLAGRIAGVFVDTRVRSPSLEQRTGNYFFGGGPLVGLDLKRYLFEPHSGLALFAHADGWVLLG